MFSMVMSNFSYVEVETAEVPVVRFLKPSSAFILACQRGQEDVRDPLQFQHCRGLGDRAAVDESGVAVLLAPVVIASVLFAGVVSGAEGAVKHS